MKIAIINRHPSDVLGGSEMQCDNIAKELSNRGHEVFYIAPSGIKNKNYKTNYQVIVSESNSKSIVAATLSISPDVVYWRFNKYYMRKSVKAFKNKGIVTIFALSHISDTKRVHYLSPPWKSPVSFLRAIKQGLESFYNYGGYKYVNGFTSLNPDYIGKTPVKEQRFVPNSVDTTVKKFNWPKPFILWVANLKPAKQPEYFIKLATEMRNEDIDFLMVGSIQNKSYEWIKKENERTPNFHYLGPKTVEEVNGIISQSMLLVHTCKPEGFCNNFIQSWLQGIPTISYEFDPAGFITKNKLGGFANGDWNIFFQQVSDYIHSPEKRHTTGTQAKKIAIKTFSIKRTVDEIERFAQDLLDKQQESNGKTGSTQY